MAIFFGFAVADSMFSGDVIIQRTVLPEDKVISFFHAFDNIVPCLNPSHTATIEAMRKRFGISIDIPPTAPKVELEAGDSLLVMSVRGLPRLDASRHEYTPEEIEGASFAFSVYDVQDVPLQNDDVV